MKCVIIEWYCYWEMLFLKIVNTSASGKGNSMVLDMLLYRLQILRLEIAQLALQTDFRIVVYSAEVLLNGRSPEFADVLAEVAL